MQGNVKVCYICKITKSEKSFCRGHNFCHSCRTRKATIRNKTKAIPPKARSKRCVSCRQIKPPSEFYKHKSRYDWLDTKCKFCQGIRRRFRHMLKQFTSSIVDSFFLHGKQSDFINYSEVQNLLGPKPGPNYHCDHIIPCKFFADMIEHDPQNIALYMKACWDVSNLRWLEAGLNVKKSASYDHSAAEEYLKMMIKKFTV